MLKSDIYGPKMNLHFKILGRKDGRSNPSIRIIREPREKKMEWISKSTESVHESTKKSISSNKSHFELPVFSW